MGRGFAERFDLHLHPNKATASITPRNDLRACIAATSPETLISESTKRIPLSDSPDYETVIPLVKESSALIVARTFSHIYAWLIGGFAGICVAQPNYQEDARVSNVGQAVQHHVARRAATRA